MHQKHRARKRERRGFVLATALCCTAVLVAFLGLAIDSAYLEFTKTRMQTAVDAAALGGAQQIRSGTGDAASAALADATRNGFTDGVNGVTVTVNSPPLSGYSTQDSTAVEVIIAQQIPTFFMSILGATSAGLQARAVARLGSAGAATCLETLDPSQSGALSISGSATLQTGCGIVVRSSNAHAITASGSATISATSISVTGGVSTSGSAKLTPNPVTGAPASSDPLSYLQAPATGGCTYRNVNVSSASSVTLPPGTYCNGISVSGTANVIFSPGGVYILQGGLSVSGNSNVSGTGVTIYNTSGNGYSYKGINISGNSDVTLSAPTTGSFAGILIFQDRSIVNGASSSFSGSSTLNLNGALYFPTTHVDYSGDVRGGNKYCILIAQTVTFSGNTTFNADYSSLPSGSPVKSSGVISE